MSSRIERAYQAARNTVKAEVRDGGVVWRPRGRIENFLTELLALATLDDCRPMAAALRESRVIEDPAPICRIRPYTQQAIWESGRGESGRGKRSAVDLVLVVEYDDCEAEVWLEVKAGAGYHGEQMRLYLDAIHAAADRAAHPRGPSGTTWRRLAVLAPGWTQVPYVHRDGEAVRLITWDQLADAARAPSASLLWQEVAAFISEQRATTGTAILGPAEVPRATDLDWLAEALAVALGSGVPHPWLAWTYSRNREMRSQSLRRVLAKHLAEGEPLEVFLQEPRGGLVAVKLGFAQGTTALQVQLSLTADYFVPHRVLRRRAAAAGLTDRGWQPRGRDDSVILSVADPVMRPTGATPDAAGEWVLAQLVTLDKKGLLLDLDGNGNSATMVNEARPDAPDLIPGDAD